MPDLSSKRSTQVFLGIAALCIAAVAAALVSQHFFDMQPCPWCVLQRLLYLTIALLALTAPLWKRTGRLVASVAIILFSLAGVAAALWQHFVAAASQSCKLTLADRIISQYLMLDSAFFPSCFLSCIHQFFLFDIPFY